MLPTINDCLLYCVSRNNDGVEQNDIDSLKKHRKRVYQHQKR